MPQLIASILQHVLVGAALAAGIWAVGLGWLGLAVRDLELADAVYAYPVGLLAWIVSAFAFLVHPLAGLVAALVLLVMPLVFARGWVARVHGALRDPLLLAAPFVVSFAVAFGTKWHGPTAHVSSRNGADFFYHVARAFSASVSVAPYHDLDVAGENKGLLEAGAALLGGAYQHFPGGDLFLFHSVSLSVVLLCSLAIGLGLLGAGRAREGRLGTVPLVALAVLAITSLDTMTQLAGSPIVSLVLPIGFALYRMIDCPPNPGWLVALAAVIGLDVLVTKVWTFPLVALLLVATMIRLRLSLRWWLVILGSGALVAAAGLVYFATAGGGDYKVAATPQFFPKHGLGHLRHFRDEAELRAAYAPIAFPGQLLFAFALLRARRFSLLLGFALAMLWGWTLQADFARLEISVGMATFVAVLFFLDRPHELLKQQWLLAGAAVSMGFAAWLKDYDELRTTLVMWFLFGATFVAAATGAGLGLSRRAYLAIGPVAACGVTIALASKVYIALLFAGLVAAGYLVSARVPTKRRRLYLATGTIGALLVATAISFRSWQYGNYRFGTYFPVLGPPDYRMWQEVDRRVPRDGLVFTNLYASWVGFYPTAGRRQLYFTVSIYSPLAYDRARQETHQTTNDRVLSGAERPAVPGYRSYWAVTLAGKPTPPGFVRVFANEKLVLSRIVSR